MEGFQDDGYETTAPVVSFEQGKSALGVLNMAGNVWEWVSDCYKEDYYKEHPEGAWEDPHGPECGAKDRRSVRGVGWNVGAPSGLRAADRDWLAPSSRYFHVGFRCAREAT